MRVVSPSTAPGVRLAPNESENQNDSHGPMDVFGSPWEENTDDLLRIVGLNINGLPIHGGSKYDMVKEFMDKYSISILCLQ